MLAPTPLLNTSSRFRGSHIVAFIAALMLIASACGVDTDPRITAVNQPEAAGTTSGADATEAAGTTSGADATEAAGTTSGADATEDASVGGSGAATPDWWFGCDAGNFVFEGVGPESVFVALGEPAADRVNLSDNPLGVGLLTDCRASNGSTRVSIIAVPPIGGLIETVDDILAIEPGAEERTIAGNRAAIYSSDDSFSPSGTAHFNIDGFTIMVTAEDRDERRFSADQLKQMAAAAAEAFLAQL